MPIIFENHSLKKYNTFNIEAKTKKFVAIAQIQDLISIHHSLKTEKLLILGAGSNLLFRQDYDGLVVKINIQGIEILEKNPQTVLIKVGAGIIWNDFVTYCVQNNIQGVENLTLIPGTVGAAPVQNIGAYGIELKDVFKACTAFEIETGNFKIFNKDDCQFDYRESIFKNEAKGKYIITDVTFELAQNQPFKTSYGAIQSALDQLNISPSISNISKIVAEIRVSKLPDPKTIGNAGSFFKNPIITVQEFKKIQEKFPEIVFYPLNDQKVKLAAGWLIEQCGWKGKVLNQTGTWKNQALVLVNHGQATGNEIYQLAKDIMTSVKEKFMVDLSPEVNIL